MSSSISGLAGNTAMHIFGTPAPLPLLLIPQPADPLSLWLPRPALVRACRADDPQAAAPPLCTMFISPLYTKFDDTCPAKHFRYYMRRKMGPPGGAICVDAKDLASCRRFD